MSDTKSTLAERFADEPAVTAALREAARDARRLHKAMGHPMATLVDGQVVWVQPEDIRIDDEPAPGPDPPVARRPSGPGRR